MNLTTCFESARQDVKSVKLLKGPGSDAQWSPVSFPQTPEHISTPRALLPIKLPKKSRRATLPTQQMRVPTSTGARIHLGKPPSQSTNSSPPRQPPSPLSPPPRSQAPLYILSSFSWACFVPFSPTLGLLIALRDSRRHGQNGQLFTSRSRTRRSCFPSFFEEEEEEELTPSVRSRRFSDPFRFGPAVRSAGCRRGWRGLRGSVVWILRMCLLGGFSWGRERERGVERSEEEWGGNGSGAVRGR